jgi:hypothetical protein
MIGPPKVINKTVDGKLLEPYEVKYILYCIYRVGIHLFTDLLAINLFFYYFIIPGTPVSSASNFPFN